MECHKILMQHELQKPTPLQEIYLRVALLTTKLIRERLLQLILKQIIWILVLFIQIKDLTQHEILM